MNLLSPAGQSGSYQPLARIPERRSSKIFHGQSESSSPESTTAPVPPEHAPPAFRCQQAITARGKSASPIKRYSSPERDYSDGNARTFLPPVLPNDILQLPRLTHPRLQLDVHLLAPLFVGGATVEGDVHIKIDASSSENKRQNLPILTVHRISATIIGVEHCKGRREIFNALTTHVLHIDELPIIGDDLRPFKVDLPIRVGPPPYTSKKAGITYLLSVLVEFRIGDQTHFVRQTREIKILSVHDRRAEHVSIEGAADESQLRKRWSTCRIPLLSRMSCGSETIEFC